MGEHSTEKGAAREFVLRAIWGRLTRNVASDPPSPRELIGLGAGIVGFVVLGLVVGLALDAWLGTSPLFVMIGLGLGIVCAAVTLIVQFRAFMKD